MSQGKSTLSEASVLLELLNGKAGVKIRHQKEPPKAKPADNSSKISTITAEETQEGTKEILEAFDAKGGVWVTIGENNTKKSDHDFATQVLEQRVLGELGTIQMNPKGESIECVQTLDGHDYYPADFKRLVQKIRDHGFYKPELCDCTTKLLYLLFSNCNTPNGTGNNMLLLQGILGTTQGNYRYSFNDDQTMREIAISLPGYIDETMDAKVLRAILVRQLYELIKDEIGHTESPNAEGRRDLILSTLPGYVQSIYSKKLVNSKDIKETLNGNGDEPWKRPALAAYITNNGGYLPRRPDGTPYFLPTDEAVRIARRLHKGNEAARWAGQPATQQAEHAVRGGVRRRANRTPNGKPWQYRSH